MAESQIDALTLAEELHERFSGEATPDALNSALAYLIRRGLISIPLDRAEQIKRVAARLGLSTEDTLAAVADALDVDFDELKHAVPHEMGDGCIFDDDPEQCDRIDDPDGGLALPCSCAERTDGDDRPLRPVVVTCGECGERWCERCQPTHGPRCHFEGEHADMEDPNTTGVDRAAEIRAAAARLGISRDDALTVVSEALDVDAYPGDAPRTELLTLVKSHVLGDDDFDELKHEMHHEMGDGCIFDNDPEMCAFVDPHHSLMRSAETGQMYAREALYVALRALRPDMADPDPEQARRAAEVVQMLVDQRGCGEVEPGEGYLTHAMDVSVFG